MRNRGNVNIFIQGLPFILERLANEKELDQNPTSEVPVISFENLKNCITRKDIANEMTPKQSNEV